jgi:hypothetical protein
MRALVLAAALLLGGCPWQQVVSPYDEVIDKGIVEFYEQFNLFVRDTADAGGKPEGTYQANTKTYNLLETKLDVLILRATSQSQGSGCKLEAKVYQKVLKLLDKDMPAELKGGDTQSTGDANGCNARLLQLVKEQLAVIRDIHSTTDKCGPADREVSCLRKATAQTYLKIANQSINAVSVVEAAKRN